MTNDSEFLMTLFYALPPVHQTKKPSTCYKKAHHADNGTRFDVESYVAEQRAIAIALAQPLDRQHVTAQPRPWGDDNRPGRDNKARACVQKRSTYICAFQSSDNRHWTREGIGLPGASGDPMCLQAFEIHKDREGTG